MEPTAKEDSGPVGFGHFQGIARNASTVAETSGKHCGTAPPRKLHAWCNYISKFFNKPKIFSNFNFVTRGVEQNEQKFFQSKISGYMVIMSDCMAAM